MNGVSINLIVTVDEHSVKPVISIGQWYDSTMNYGNKPTPPTSLGGHRNTLAVYKRVVAFAEELQDE